MEPTLIQRQDLDTLVGTKIKDIEIYRRAFTHKSALKQYSFESSNETLEFMGDSVLGFVITKFLFDKYEKNQEGFLTRARTKLVRGKTLSTIAEKLNLDKWIWMDDKGMRNGWVKNPKMKRDERRRHNQMPPRSGGSWPVQDNKKDKYVYSCKELIKQAIQS